MRDAASAIDAGRRAFAAADWTHAYDLLASVRSELDADDLALLARSAWFLSRVPESIELSEEVFARYRAEERPADAAATALLVTLLWFGRGEMGAASGWMSRSRRVLARLPDGPLWGYLAYLEGMIALFVDGRPPDDSIRRLGELTARFADPALDALELAVSGVADLRYGETARGFARLDEAMLPVIAGRLPVEWAGDIYCTVIHVCHELADFTRMAEWTSATERWCRHFASDAVYSGICRVHRLELRGAHGEWSEIEPRLAAESAALVDGNVWVAGEGFYQLGELRRRRGDAAGAREAYAAARQAGVDPQPGEAMLMLHEGRAADAWAALTAALHDRDRVGRVRLLRAAVEIALATDRRDQAEALCRELRDAAAQYGTPGFAAWADHAEGMLAFAEGRDGEALTALRSAASAFRRDRQPYETAAVLTWMARTHARTGDDDEAARLRAEAHDILARLGAHDAVRPGADARIGPLTAREAEVLACVAAGASNREAAARLFISEKTVGRHLANVYVKLGVGSRTAAAAWWREHAAPPSP